MKTSASTLAVGLLLSVALPSGVAMALDPGEQLMLERANYWRAQQRLDLAGDILNKVLAVNPSQPDALYQQGMLAVQQGDRADAQHYFDRLRQLAPADKRAAELVATLTQPAAAPQAAASAKSVTVAVVAPNPPPPAPAARSVRPTPELVVASADSDDLVPAKLSSPASLPAASPSRGMATGMVAAAAQDRQVASLSPTTVSDGDLSISATGLAPPSASSSDLGTTAKTVQVAQVELEAPPPVGGYLPLGNLKPYSPSDTLEMDIDRNLLQLESQSNPELIAGLGFRAHSGTSGTSSLFEVGLPVQVSFSPWYTGTASIAVLPVYLDAGSGGPVTTFGANPILAAEGVPMVAAGAQNATGVGLLGSYALGDFSGQFGTTPLGFPVTNLVGDLAYIPKFFGDTLSVRIEALRQPVTDSVLSYAGTHASLAAANLNGIRPGAFGTNPTWGGVVKTGGQVTAFYDNQMVGAYAGAGANWLTGTNVAQNSSINALLGAYFRPWKGDNWTLRVGVSLYYTGYDKNLDGFTFGQGGYFSPQDFEGLGFPVEFTGHNGPWSYLAAVTLGVQHFNESSSAVFPNNPNQQIALETLSPSTAFLGGLHSTGIGFNLKGQLEYAVDPTLSVGIAGSLDNGNSYDEVIGKIYLRKTFDWFAPVAMKDDPASIAARDQPMSRL